MSTIPDIGTIEDGNSPGYVLDGVITLSTGEKYLFGLYKRRPIDGPGNAFILDVQQFDQTTIELGQKHTSDLLFGDNLSGIQELAVIQARLMQDAYDLERAQ